MEWYSYTLENGRRKEPKKSPAQSERNIISQTSIFVVPCWFCRVHGLFVGRLQQIMLIATYRFTLFLFSFVILQSPRPDCLLRLAQNVEMHRNCRLPKLNDKWIIFWRYHWIRRRSRANISLQSIVKIQRPVCLWVKPGSIFGPFAGLGLYQCSQWIRYNLVNKNQDKANNKI